MDNQEKLFRIGIAIQELYKSGEAVVLIGEVFQSVGDVLDRLNIEYKFEAASGNYNRIYMQQ